jgi:hypothetical protein
LQWVSDGLSTKFEGIKEALLTRFLPALFGVEDTNTTLWQLACLPVKKSGLEILDPMTILRMKIGQPPQCWYVGT